MSADYKGMRWFKCDLHMHTPADSKHWCGSPLLAGQEAVAAKEFAEACHLAGLDVVGITDHNYLSKNFLPYLEKAFNDIKIEHSHTIHLFPGFELEADVGKGMHVLCLFEPGTDAEIIDHALTKCGVGIPRINDGKLAKSTTRLPEIINIVQESNGNGIVIVPHVFENSLFDGDRINEWLQQEEYKNPNLLAVEVNKTIEKMSNAFQKLFRSGDDCIEEWKRIRPIATLMSSDNKKLIDMDEKGNPVSNSIGYRYTWIKMSNPSIESLRQAFLDHESRVVVPESVITDIRPDKRFHQSKIRSLSIKNVAFLADQEIKFSSNMNCIIGGRGSGKSTLLEYLRIIFNKDNQKDIDSGTKVRIERIKSTLNNSNAELKATWSSLDEVKDCIVWKNGDHSVEDRELIDPDTFFNSLPVQFFSQQQLNSLTESRADGENKRQAQRLLELIDGFSKEALVDLADQERKIKVQIQDEFANIRKARLLEKEQKRLSQEYDELDRQWKARSEIQEEAQRHHFLKLESRYLDEVLGIQGKRFSEVANLADEVAAAHESFDIEGSPHATWLLKYDNLVKGVKQNLAQSIRTAIQQYENYIESIKVTDPEWLTIQEELTQADKRFNDACVQKGLAPGDVGHLQEVSQSREAKIEEIKVVDFECKSLLEKTMSIEMLISQLYQVWRQQFSVRLNSCQKANELVLENGKQRFIEVSAQYQQDRIIFKRLWQSFAPDDKRLKLGRSWDSIGERLYTFFIDQKIFDSPWQALYTLLLKPDSIEETLGENAFGLIQYIEENPEKWERLLCSRVLDTVDLKLYRNDGTLAGSIADGSLSDGQRNTAALALLLAQEGGPLVIDQPEDELDSNFVFSELIPILRKIKIRRQIIIATHNANLPVNGDAELVYAFETINGRGMNCANGGLDQGEVTKAILDIMEGTEEAFRRRREKYHF